MYVHVAKRIQIFTIFFSFPSFPCVDYSSPCSTLSLQSFYSCQPVDSGVWGDVATDLDSIQLDWSEQELRELNNMFLMENYMCGQQTLY